MKIAITGAHRVGKTTLGIKLQESLSDYDFKMEPYYELEESGFDFSETPNTDDFLEQLLHSVKQISASNKDVIFDRCPVDFLAYIHAIDKTINIQSLFNKIAGLLMEIDILVFVPIEDPDLILCQESDLPKLRNEVHELLNEWIWDLGIPAIEVNGTLLNRRNQVLGKIYPESKSRNLH